MPLVEVVELDAFYAVTSTETSAELSHRLKLPLADGIIYTIPKQKGAELLTQDTDLEGLEGVQYIKYPARVRKT